MGIWNLIRPSHCKALNRKAKHAVVMPVVLSASSILINVGTMKVGRH